MERPFRIAQLTVCEWQGPHLNSADFADPTWDQVEQAIRALDGGGRNDLYLTPDADNSETYLAVGGGAGRYVVTGSVDNERFPTVVRGDGAREPTERLVVGGQGGDYPQSWILDLDTVLRAVRAFFHTGEFAGDGVDWIDA